MSNETPAMPAGWYHADGDPAGTQRYWDGETWQGGPQAIGGGMSGDSTMVNGMQISGEWKRIGARVIDVILAVIISVIMSAIGLGAASFDFNSDETALWFVGGAALVGVIVGFLWDALFVSFLGGTPGKLMLGMRVVDAESGTTPPGPKFGFMRALNRLLNITPAIGGLIGLIVGVVSLVFLFTDDRKRTVMDRIAGTVVVDIK